MREWIVGRRRGPQTPGRTGTAPGGQTETPHTDETGTPTRDGDRPETGPGQATETEATEMGTGLQDAPDMRRAHRDTRRGQIFKAHRDGDTHRDGDRSSDGRRQTGRDGRRGQVFTTLQTGQMGTGLHDVTNRDVSSFTV
jgi:hypothetical protein